MQARAAIVTGGGRGIGRAVALELARAGTDVAVAVNQDLAAAEAVASEVRETGRRALAIRVDVRDWDQVERLVQATLEEFGQLDFMINNAGVTRDALLLRMDDAAWDAVMNVNLKGVFHGTRAALRPMLKQRSGRIVNISSVIGITGNPGQANYAAAKAGIIGFTRSTAREVASRGITVNAVAPGYIETRMTGSLSAEIREEILKRIPLGRLGRPEDVAGVVAFLCSEASAYMTAQVLVVDGGMVA